MMEEGSPQSAEDILQREIPPTPTREEALKSVEDGFFSESVTPAWARKLQRDLNRVRTRVEAEKTAKPGEVLREYVPEPPPLPALPELSHRAEIRRLAAVTLFAMDLGEKEVSAGEMIQRLEAMIPGAPEWPDEVFGRVKVYLDHPAEVDGDLKVALKNWTLDRLGAVERAILRVGTAELRYCDDIPPKVTINECIELAKDYCEPVSYKFINGVLDGVRRNLGKADFEVRKSTLPRVKHRPAKSPVSEILPDNPSESSQKSD